MMMEEEQNDDEKKKPGFAPCRLSLIYTEASVAKRRKLARGTVSIKQLGQCHIAGCAKISLPERPRKHFEGSSCGDTIVGLTVPDPEADSTWKLNWCDKKVLLGKKIWVGGWQDSKRQRRQRSAGGGGETHRRHDGPDVIWPHARQVLR